MNPLIENLIISILTGLMAGASLLQSGTPGAARDWVVIGSAALIAFGGSLINGLRQLQKEPPGA